jgi:hypothetical protein
MNAPIDIVISIIKRHLNEERKTERACMSYQTGKIETYEELIAEFEGFKRLFN